MQLEHDCGRFLSERPFFYFHTDYSLPYIEAMGVIRCQAESREELRNLYIHTRVNHQNPYVSASLKVWVFETKRPVFLSDVVNALNSENFRPFYIHELLAFGNTKSMFERFQRTADIVVVAPECNRFLSRHEDEMEDPQASHAVMTEHIDGHRSVELLRDVCLDLDNCCVPCVRILTGSL